MDRYQDFIKNTIVSIHANIREIRERKGFAEPQELDYIEGKLIAYNGVLSILKEEARAANLPLDELGLAQ
jgi:hypothetical protein